MKIIFASDLYRAGAFTVNFTYTLRNEPVDFNQLSGDVVLDINGTFYQKNEPSDSITIDVVGGIDKYLHAQSDITAYPFYMTNPQKVAFYNLMRLVSNQNRDIEINSNNASLEAFLQNLYNNFMG
jgi:hypothetical protein